MKKSVESLLKIAKKGTDKSIYSKLKNIKNERELEEAIQMSVITSLKNHHKDMEIKLNNLENQSRDAFFAKNKVLILPSKILHLQANFTEKEFEKTQEHFNLARREIENV